MDFDDQKEYFKYASGDKIPTQRGIGVGIYKCFCKEFTDITDLVSDIHILGDEEESNEKEKAAEKDV